MRGWGVWGAQGGCWGSPTAPRCKQNQDMLSFYAIVIGLNNAAISRLRLTWEVRGCFGDPPARPPRPPPRLLTAPPRGGFFLVVLQKLPGKFKNLFRKFENLTVRGGVWGTHGGSACKGGRGCL